MFGSPQRVSVTVSSQPPPEAAGISNNLFALMSVQDSLVQHSRTVFATAAAVTLLIAYFLGKKDGALFALPFSIIGICIVGIWLIVLQSRLRSSAFVERLITWSEEGKYVQKPFSLFKECRDARFAKNDFKVTLYQRRAGRIHRACQSTAVVAAVYPRAVAVNGAQHGFMARADFSRLLAVGVLRDLLQARNTRVARRRIAVWQNSLHTRKLAELILPA